MSNPPSNRPVRFLSNKYPTSGKISSDWHIKATESAESKIEYFINALISKAEAISARDSDGVVTQSNVDEAMNEIKKGYKSSLTGVKSGLLISSLLTGIFVPNFFSQLTKLIELAKTNQPIEVTQQTVGAYFILALITLGISIALLTRDES